MATSPLLFAATLMASAGTSPAYQLVQEPSAGMAPIYALLTGARRSIDVSMYELADPVAEQDLIAAHDRGVRVRVLLDRAYAGGSVNRAAFGVLHSAGVEARWAAPNEIDHQKTIVVDGSVAAVGTGNLVAWYYAATVDAWVIDSSSADVAGIARTFGTDFSSVGTSPGRGVVPAGSALVWSPDATAAFVGAIGSARVSVELVTEELASRPVVGALAAAARRGVRCQVAMEAGAASASALSLIDAAGCQVHLDPGGARTPYLHEKALLIDGQRLLVGSTNLSTASLHYDRELSLDLTTRSASAAVTAVARSLAQLFDGTSAEATPVGAL